MKLVIGLGNPGKEYDKTRHNVGYAVVDTLVSEISRIRICDVKFRHDRKLNSEIAKVDDLVFAKPTTFMNNSGLAVSKLASYFRVARNDIYVVHDDLDINIGDFKIQNTKGPHNHNGVLSVEEHLGGRDFWRVRVGIENRKRVHDDTKSNLAFIPGEDYVLSRFGKDEIGIVDKATKQIVEDLLGIYLAEGKQNG
ncbi:aminoacyl-tRNA hydrolase [Candidatus Woesebacteria bacterium]|nr:MAG: aminoacyl-tRNA hydrolase [Candidatus Woesebacteria bacterium]